MLLPSGHLHRIEKLLCQLAPSERFSSTSGCLSVLERFTDSFQVSKKGRSINRPDDVESRPDAYLRKARIAFQNEPSGRWCIVYGNWRFDFNRPNVSSSWSRRTRIRYGNCVLKFSCPNTPASWSGRAKHVMEITCSGRASVRTIEPSRPDNVLIQERFLRKNLRKSCRTVVRPDGRGRPSGRLPGKICLTLILTPSL
jgi:hypothetical protein